MCGRRQRCYAALRRALAGQGGVVRNQCMRGSVRWQRAIDGGWTCAGQRGAQYTALAELCMREQRRTPRCTACEWRRCETSPARRRALHLLRATWPMRRRDGLTGRSGSRVRCSASSNARRRVQRCLCASQCGAPRELVDSVHAPTRSLLLARESATRTYSPARTQCTRVSAAVSLSSARVACRYHQRNPFGMIGMY